jgi:hypothetical protein
MGFDLLNLSYIAAYKSAENGMIDDATFETQAERILGRALGPVGIQDSHPGLVVIQALDGPIRFE